MLEIIAVLCLMVLCAGSGEASPRGEWPMPARDAGLSARSDLPLGMKQAPREVWSYDIGQAPVRWAMCADVDDDGKPEVLFGPAPLVCADLEGKEKWRAACGTVAAVADLDGDGSTEIVADGPVVLSGKDGKILWTRTGPGYVLSFRTHVGKLLPGVKGLQIACVSEQYEANYAQLWSFAQGMEKPELVWEREFNKGPVYAHATSCAGRYDPDTMCVAAAVHGGLVVMDTRDGKDLFRLYWRPEAGREIVRNYGSLSIRDLDGDGKSEFVFLNDLIAMQIGVISPARGPAGEAADQNTPLPAPEVPQGKLSAYPEGPLVWRRYFGEWFPQGEATLHLPPTPLLDIDGDGRQEIVASLHRKGWELKGYDALTGEEKLSVPGLYVLAAADLDRDGTAEIAASREPARTPGEFPTLVVGNCRNGTWKERFRRAGCRLEGTDAPLWPPGHSGRNYDPRVPVILESQGSRHLVVSEDTNGDGRADRLLRLSAPKGQPLRPEEIPVDGSADLKVLTAAPGAIIATTTRAEMHVLTPDGKPLASWGCGRPGISGAAVADLDGDGQNEMVVCRADRRVAALKGPSGEGKEPQSLWTADGWGFPTSGKYGPSPLVADFNGDGRKETLVACVAGQGSVGVRLLDSSGKALWTAALPGVVDTRLYSPIARASAGDFDGDGLPDIYIAARVAPTGNDAAHSFALQGKSGRILWHNDASDPAFYLHTAGPTGMPAIQDVNGDGRDDVLLVALDLCTALSGRDGSILQPPLIANAIWQQKEKSTQWTAYGTQLPADLDGDGIKEILLCGGWGQVGAWTMDRKLLWTLDPGREEHAYMLPGIADVDGDKKLEIGMMHLGGTFRCYDAATGTLKWEIKGLRAYTDVTTADADGDGLEEFILGVAAIKAEGPDRGRVLWEVMPTRSPALADLDGDGRAEIIAGTEDGKVRVFK